MLSKQNVGENFKKEFSECLFLKCHSREALHSITPSHNIELTAQEPV